MKLFLSGILIILSITIRAQLLNNQQSRWLYLFTDTVTLDSLSIVPGSVMLFNKNLQPVHDTLYKIDFAKGLLFPSSTLKMQEVYAIYRVFPMAFSAKSFHKNYETYNFSSSETRRDEFTSSLTGTSRQKEESIIKNGNISRGITVGSNQNTSVSSNLNLQLSGKLSDNLFVTAAISDNNIPIQPDGYTQQIQEFDKVFIQLYNSQMDIIFGDFEINSPSGYYMKYQKKLLGATGKTKIAISKHNTDTIITQSSLAVSRGKFNRYSFTGLEGNQGPYRLRGANNETYIIILAGSERVYIDGHLLKRGEDRDYIIDYNTAELTFTATTPITKDKRIIVEFQYSEQSYARFLLQNSTEYKTNKNKIWINFYSEEDSRNQTLQQDLKPEHKKLLSQIGDSLNRAWVPNVDTVEFKNDAVLYKQIDTTINNITYRIFVHSTNPDSAIYRVGFAYTGDRGGNYVLIQSSANGKVYQWVAPVNGIPAGNYEPARLLTAPTKKQLLTIGAENKLSSTTTLFFELAGSNNDKNTFSSKDNADNTGIALHSKLIKKIPARDTTIHTEIWGAYNFIHQNFEGIERFKNIEFERDWNLTDSKDNEQMAEAGILFSKKKLTNNKLQHEFLSKGNFYKANKSSVETKNNYKGFNLDFTGSNMISRDKFNNTTFYRHYSKLSKNISFLTLGVLHDIENNRWHQNTNDSLLPNSFFYNRYGGYLTNNDTTNIRYLAQYTQREDFLPYNNTLKFATLGKDYTTGFEIYKNPNNTLTTNITYRQLEIKNDSIVKYSSQKTENTTLGKTEHNLRTLKGFLSVNTNYQIGSGLEIKKNISYLEVSPGQGNYTWSDYNNNGLKELNEFEVANFKDQANYIRLFTPTNEYIKAYSNQLNQSFILQPRHLLKKKNFFSRFENRFAYGLTKKNTLNNLRYNLNPFQQNIADTNLIHVNSNYRNTFSYNKLNQYWGIEYLTQKSTNKLLLMNGFNTNKAWSNGINLRIKIIRDLTYFNEINKSNKYYSSEFFSTNNYNINGISDKSTLRFNPSLKLVANLEYEYSEKTNTSGGQNLFKHNTGSEIKYSVTTSGNLVVRGNYIFIVYKDLPGTPVAYEMLQGLQPGHNITWGVLFQKNLSGGLEMYISYDGRKTGTEKPVHTGTIQLRANF